MSQPNITLYTTQTPNGIKISIALEELGYVSFLGRLKFDTNIS
jgi:glutathione S-transferase